MAGIYLFSAGLAYSEAGNGEEKFSLAQVLCKMLWLPTYRSLIAKRVDFTKNIPMIDRSSGSRRQEVKKQKQLIASQS